MLADRASSGHCPGRRSLPLPRPSLPHRTPVRRATIPDPELSAFVCAENALPANQGDTLHDVVDESLTRYQCWSKCLRRGGCTAFLWGRAGSSDAGSCLMKSGVTRHVTTAPANQRIPLPHSDAFDYCYQNSEWDTGEVLSGFGGASPRCCCVVALRLAFALPSVTRCRTTPKWQRPRLVRVLQMASGPEEALDADAASG